MNSFCEVVIQTDGTPIDVEELTEFLYHFRAAYAAAVRNDEQQYKEPIEIETEAVILAKSVREKIHEIDWMEISELAHTDLEDSQLGIIDIRRENPLTILFSGSVIALTAAVILSGGKLKFGPFKVQLPPLGSGIKSLRKAFGRPPRLQQKNQPKNRNPRP